MVLVLRATRFERLNRLLKRTMQEAEAEGGRLWQCCVLFGQPFGPSPDNGNHHDQLAPEFNRLHSRSGHSNGGPPAYREGLARPRCLPAKNAQERLTGHSGHFGLARLQIV
jgi:hypothetical protein